MKKQKQYGSRIRKTQSPTPLNKIQFGNYDSNDLKIVKGSPKIGVRTMKPKGSWATKEGLVVSSLILIFMFSIMSIIFKSVWSSFTFAFQVLSGVMFAIFLIIAFFGFRFLIKDREEIWAHEREGLVLFLIGSLITILLPIFGAVTGQEPDVFFGNYNVYLWFGIIMIIVGSIIIAWFGGFFSIWFFGLIYFLVMASHEAFVIIIFTHHFGPYDQYYNNLGLLLILTSAILFVYHEFKFLHLSKLIKRANYLRSQGRFKEAMKPLNRALRIYPRYATAWNNKGNVLINLGRHKEAIKCYDKALAISPWFKVAKQNKTQAIQIP